MGKTIQTVDLSNTAGLYYGPATVSGGKVLHISGQPGNMKDGYVPEDYESQIHLCLFNLRKLIIAAGANIENIAKLNIYIVNYDVGNRKHAKPIQRFFGHHRPAQTLVPVPKLAVPSWLIEIDATIALSEPSLPPTLPEATAWVPLADGKGIIDVGAGWINNSNQSRVYALAKRYGAETIVQNTQGNVVLQSFDGSCSPFAYGELPNYDEAAKKNVAEIRDLCEAECQALDTWKPKNTSLDAVTFEAFLRSKGAGKEALGTATIWTRAMLGLEPSDISALYFLNYCKSGGGLLQMRSDRKDGGQYLRIRTGTQTFSLGLASELPEGVVRLSSPVQNVVQQNNKSIKVQSTGKTYSARKVITTVPGPALKNISFYPELPPVKRAWSESLIYGYYTKAMMEFKSPFWVERGYCGLVNSFVGPAGVIRDSCIPQDNKYVLTCFMGGEPGRAWAALPHEGRVKALLEQIGKLYGGINAEDQFISLNAYEWPSDQWAGFGCPCTSLPPGVLDSLGGDGLREACGDLHFAGTETAGEWKGYMEGAIRSGERVAAEVAKDLKSGVVSRL
ncbi:hypothetical protein ACHAPJ_011167 [Fusarium lateritium]